MRRIYCGSRTSAKEFKNWFKYNKRLDRKEIKYYICTAIEKCNNTVVVAQLVRASDCGSEGRGFKSHLPPKNTGLTIRPVFLFIVKKIAHLFLLLKGC
jgi:hypothetical protein